MPRKGKVRDVSTWSNIILLIVILLIIDLAMVYVIPFLFTRALTDYYDFGYYIAACQKIFSGSLPYFNFQFDYPPLSLIPMIIAYLPACAFGTPELFVICFQAEMFICNAGIVALIYLITKRIYNERAAFMAGFMYVAAFSAQYFAMLRYDALPVFLMMLAIWFVMEHDSRNGYISAILGSVVKLFPCVTIPVFLASEKNIFASLKKFKNEIIVSAAGIVVITFVFWNTIIEYVQKSLIRDHFVSSSLEHLIVVIINPPSDTSSNYYTAITVIIIFIALITLLYYADKIRDLKARGGNTNILMLKSVLSLVVLFSVSAKFISPQYQLWYVPLMCILIAGDLTGVVLFAAFQIACYIEFPLAFGFWYVNNGYLSWEAIPLFAIKYILLFSIVAHCLLKKNACKD